MNRHLICGLLGALGVVGAARAEVTPLPDNPYVAIVSRNVFGLVPIPTNAPVDPTPAVPPPKITPNGIMDIFGNLQALFKAALPAKPGQPPHDESYVLAVGESQDDIEVTKIDKAAGVITFNNHGVVQELPLVPGEASSSAAPAGGPAGGGSGAGNFGAGPGGPGAGNRFGRNPVMPGGSPGAAGNSGYGGAASYGGAGMPSGGGLPSFGATGDGAYPHNNAQSTEALSPEAQVLMMEKNRLDTQEAVNRGIMPPLPPTPITPPDATGVGGRPLVSTPPPPP